MYNSKHFTAYAYFTAIILGIICGMSAIPALEQTGLIISEIFIKIFKCISLPIIALSLIVTLAQSGADADQQKIWQKTLSYTLGTTVIAATVAAFLYWFISPALIHSVTPVQSIAASTAQNQGYWSYLLNLIPTSILSPFLENQVMGALFVSMVVGFAIRSIPDEQCRLTMTRFFKGAHGIFMVITKWVVTIIPIALFGFITSTVVQLQQGSNLAGLGSYLSIIVLANLIQGFIILPILLYQNGINPFATLRGMLPALSVAFFSKSSSGTLPITMETMEKNLHIPKQITRLILPLCTSINMNGCAAFIFTTVIYLMQNNGIEITTLTMIAWIFIATIAAIGNAGVPMGCFFLSASLLTTMNVPITLLGLILPFYSVIDMIETALNVWSDSCVTVIVNEQTQSDNTAQPVLETS